MRSYEADKRRVDRFEPEIKRIVGEHLIATADANVDRRQATDLLVLEIKPLTIACRVRTHGYLRNFANEFTIRAGRPNGRPTELSKIVDGWCDYGFYSFADEHDECIAAWTLYRYDVFRATLVRRRNLVERIADAIPNEDGSSTFVAFEWTEFPPEMVVAAGSYGTLPLIGGAA